MKVRTCKRAFAMLLTIAMMATLLVVPAAAATETVTEVFNFDGTNSFFTIENTTVAAAETPVTATIGGKEMTLSKYLPMTEANHYFSFTAPADGTLTIYGVNSSNKDFKLQVNTGTKANFNGGSNPACVGLVSIPVKAGAYQLKRANAGHIYYMAFTYTKTITVDKTALETAISNANSAKTGVQISTTEGAAELAPSVFWVTQEEMTALTGAITTATGVLDNGDADQSAVDGAVTTLNNAVSTFTAAKKPGTKTVTDAELVAGLKDNLTAVLADWALTQSVNDPQSVEDAVNLVKAKIGLTGETMSEVTVAVTVDPFTAATAGDKATPAGAQGSFTYSIALSKGEANDTVTDTVTITPTAYVPTPLTYSLRSTIAAANGALTNNAAFGSSGDNIPGSAGSIWNSPYFSAVVEDGGTNTTFLYRPSKSSIDTGKAEDKNGVQFTTQETATVVVAASSTGSSNYSIIALKNAAGEDQVFESATAGSKSTVTKLATADCSGADTASGAKYVLYKGAGEGTVTYKDLPAGTYTLYSPAATATETINPTTRGFRLYDITVTEADGTVKAALADAEITKVTVTPATKEMTVSEDESKPTTAKLTYAVEPATAPNRFVKWTSSDTTVATVDAATGAVTALKAGTATITATSLKTGTAVGTCALTVKAPTKAVSSITVNGPSETGTQTEVILGADVTADVTRIMTAVVDPTTATNASTLTWKLTDKAGNALTGDAAQDVTIAQDGTDPLKATVTVKTTAKSGEYKVVATIDDSQNDVGGTTVTGSRDLVVKALEVEGVTIDGVTGNAKTVKYGEELTLAATVAFADNGVKPASGDDAVTWESSNESVATVAADGKVTILTAGTTNITATSVKDTTKASDALALTVEEADVTLGIKTRNVPITAAGREVVFKVGAPGQAENTLVNLPTEVLKALSVKVTKDSGTEDISASLSLAQEITEDEGAPMHWNYKMTLPKNESGAAETYTVTVSFAGITGKYNAATTPATTTFTVVAAGTKVIHVNRQTEQGAIKTITSGDTLVLSLDAMVEVDDQVSAEDTAKLVFTWTKDDKSITAQDSDCTEEGHVGHRQSTYTVTGATTADAGAYKCVITVQGDSTIASQTATIQVKVNQKDGPAAPTTAAFEASTMTLSGLTTDMEYSLDGGATWTAATGTSATLDAAKVTALNGIQVRVKETTEQKASAPQTITLTRATAPTLRGEDKAIVIVGWNSAYTYQIKKTADAETAWADVTVVAGDAANEGKITTTPELVNGTEYVVRVAAKGTVLVSEANPVKPSEDTASAQEKANLRAAITAASTERAKADDCTQPTGTTTDEVTLDEVFWTQDTVDALAQAITDATAVANNANATSAQVAKAESDLADAVSTFIAAKKVGTKDSDQPTPPAVDKGDATKGRYVLDVNGLEANSELHGGSTKGGTSEYFTMVWNNTADKNTGAYKYSKIMEMGTAAEYQADTYSAAFEANKSLDLGGKAEGEGKGKYITFTTTSANAKVKIYFGTGGSAEETGKERRIAILSGNMTSTDVWNSQQSEAVIGATKATSKEFQLGDAGLYGIGSPKDPVLIYKIVVLDAAAAPTTKTITLTVPEGVTVTDVTGGTLADSKITAEATATVTFKLTVATGYTLGTVTGATESAGVYTVTGETVTITATKDTAPTVDKTALNAALAAAKAIDTTEVATSTDGKDVPVNKTWVTAEVKKALADAIADAEALAAEATQPQVDAAAKALDDAVKAWKPELGTQAIDIPEVTDKTSLTEAIAKATELKTGVKTSADGKDIPTDETWVTTAVMEALDKAITDAQAVVDKADATADEITAAGAAIKTAAAAFKPAAGTKTDAPVVTKHAITVAPAANGTVTTSPADEAEAGTSVTISAKPDSGYVVDAVTVKDASNATVSVVNNKFTMPASAVTVTVTFKKQVNGTGGSTATGGNPGVIKVNGDGKTETVENADGSKTTTTTDKDGNKTVVTEAVDGSKTEIVSKKDGEKTITVTNKDGEETVSVKVPATVPAPETPFTDVPEEHWAKEAIDTMAGLGLVKGVDDVNHVYDMTSNITRGALASVLYRFSNGKSGIESSFTDVLAGAWYTDGVAWAAKVGVVNGYENGSFGPDNAISRQELAVMLYRYAKLIGMDVATKAEITRFNDSESVASWAKDAMTWCVEAGIVKGVGGNTLNPEGVASRAECAVMLSRFIDLV